MELEHAFQQSGFMLALQIFIAGTLLTPGVLGGGDLYRRFVAAGASCVVSFGPMALLIYVLCQVSHLC
jgi:hypothetical protein